MDGPETYSYHEAGHCVRCYQLSRKFKSASIAKVDNKRPSVEIEWGSTADERGLQRLNEDKVAILTSGWAAESVLEPSRGGRIDPLEDDFQQAAGAAKYLSQGDDELMMKIIREKFNESLTELKKDWRAVEALARALMVSNRLDYEQAIRIIEDALPPKSVD